MLVVNIMVYLAFASAVFILASIFFWGGPPK